MNHHQNNTERPMTIMALLSSTPLREIARRKVSQIDEPLIDPLPDGAIAIIPLLGQADEANVILLACFVAHGNPGAMRLALDIDEVLPALSRAVLEGLGRKPRDQAAE